MTYEEMKRRVERLEVLQTQMEALEKIKESPINSIELYYTDARIHVQPGWISESKTFERMTSAIKAVAQEISEEIKGEIAKLEADE